MPLSLNCIGILRKTTNSNNFNFVVRWYIYKDPSETVLPLPDDKFKLKIFTRDSKEYLKPDGTFGDPNNEYSIEIFPMKYLMIEPPLDKQTKRKLTPYAPFNLVNGDDGLGIFHILNQTHISTYAKLLVDETVKFIKSSSNLQKHSVFKTCDVNSYTRKFCNFILENKIKPKYLQAILLNEFRVLEKNTFANKKTNDSEISKLFTFHLADQKIKPRKDQKSNQTNLAWENAAFLFELLKNVKFLGKLNSIIEEPENIKSQISIQVGQGINIIDYWCSPRSFQLNRIESECGKSYSLSESLGLGLTIGNIEKQKIQNLYDAGDEIIMNVEYVPAKLAILDKLYDGKFEDNHILDYIKNSRNLISQNNIITKNGTNSLANLITNDSSCQVDLPKNAEIDFDLYLYQLNTKGNDVPENYKKSEHLTMLTGDGRIQFKITPPDSRPFPILNATNHVVDYLDATIVTGFNIYGVWEPFENTDPLKVYFIDENRNPSLQEIKNWLMTRRYSYNLDLKDTFPVNNPNISGIIRNPPFNPIFQAPDTLTNPEEITNLLEEFEVVNEELPSVNKGFFVANFNIRDGFKAFDLLKHLTWDCRPDNKEEYLERWLPELWRDLSLKAHPQRYRFWVTAVDLFGQESDLCPVKVKESEESELSRIFFFKNRLALLPPPVDSESHSDKCSPLSLRKLKACFVSVSNKLIFEWESPMQSYIGIGNSPEHPIPDDRIPKEQLKAHILILRKPYVGEETSKINFDNNSIPFKDSLLNNDKWNRAYNDLKYQNPSWIIFREVPNITNSILGNNKWKYELDLSNPLDKGFDYLGIIGFEIRDEFKQFWGNNTKHRNLKIISENPIKAVEIRLVEESPSWGEVTYTDSVSIPNYSAPRSIIVNDQLVHFHPAKPILSLPALNRDLVLANILVIPNEIRKKPTGENEVVFETEGITFGQKKMIEASMYRTNIVDENKLRIPKQILINETKLLNQNIFINDLFSNESNQKNIKHSIIGFRGLVNIPVLYNSIYSSYQGYFGESEAITYMIYQTRIPLDFSKQIAESISSIKSEFVTPNRYKVELAPDIKLNEFKQPITVLIKNQNNDVRIHNLISSNPIDTNIFEIEVSNEILGNPMIVDPKNIQFIVASVLLDEEIVLTESLYYTKDILIPIGGGHKELFIWHIVSKSPTGSISNPIALAPKIFESSIIPSVPVGFTVKQINSIEDKNTFYIDRTVLSEKKWLPNILKNNSANLKNLPRLAIIWEKNNDFDANICLAIEREVSKEGIQLKSRVDEKSDWEIVSEIEKFKLKNALDNPEGLIRKEWFSSQSKPSIYKWLYETMPIHLPFESEEPEQLIGPKSKLNLQGLNARQGIRTILIGDKEKAQFIDYFYENSPEYAMDTFNSYKYRIRSYLDLGLGGEYGYLYSSPTEWTEWIRPSFPEFSIVPVSSSIFPNSLITPKIRFIFTIPTSLMNCLKNLDSPKPLFYRIIIKKKIDSSITTNPVPNKYSTFVEIGKLLDIGVLEIEPQIIEDIQIERTDIGTIIRQEYLIEASVIAKEDDKIYFVRKPTRQDPFIVSLEQILPDKEYTREIFLNIV